MQCPDLGLSCGGWVWMIVGCCYCRSCTSSCPVCSALTTVLMRRDLSKDAELLMFAARERRVAPPPGHPGALHTH
jgi:hypothetical protein